MSQGNAGPSSAVKVRELQRLSRVLASKQLQRRGLRKKLDRVEREIRDAKRALNAILEDAAKPVELPRCDACGEPIGSNALCESCQAVIAFIKGDAGRVDA